MSKRKRKGSVFANKATNIYHDSNKPNDSCREGEIKRTNLEHFDSPELAELAGRKPCMLCYSEGQTES